MTLVHGLPAHFPASVFVVLHIPANKPSTLPTLLSRAGPLRAFHPHDHEPIERRRIYVAPPDCHLLVEVGQVRLSKGLKEKWSRPAIDPLCAFSSPRVWSAGGRSDPDWGARRRNRWTAGGEAKRRCGDGSRSGLGPFPPDATQRIGVCHRRLYRAIVQHCASFGPPRGR